MSKYDHKAIEKKWQKKWEDSNAFRAEEDSTKQKLYVLDMFPYPSGAGIHLGHAENYTATDIYSRFKRMQGYNVLHPMGWDAFGLPAENYAIKSGVPPQKTTDDAIENFRKQIKSLGLSYDWSREVGTHTPEYYNWTQWFFLFLYTNGLAEKRMAKVNWCPKDQTVLANEQTVSESGEKGVCFRCGTKVIQKDLEQWFFKITEFADALVDDLDQVDWPESTKINQRNWIGRSEGAEIEFAVAGSDKKIKVFTTRADTIFGATYVVLAPEHPFVAEFAEHAENRNEIEKYVEAAKNKTDLERQEEAKEKTGVELKGIKAINPATKEEIPIFIADYVLGSYGTGAIMAVPAHDERDGEFAKKFKIPFKQVIAPVFTLDGASTPQEGKELTKREVVSVILHNPKNDKYLVLKWPQKDICGFIGGGLEEGETEKEAAAREIKEETGYTDFTIHTNVFPIFYGYGYKPRKDVNCFDYEYFLVADLNSEVQTDLHPDDVGAHEMLWLGKEEVEKTLTLKHHKQLWHNYHDNVTNYPGEGILINSESFNGLESTEAKKKITEAVGGKMVKTYRLRDWLISRQRYWGAPIPVVYDPEGKPHPIPEEYLPWLLPTDVEYLPHGTSPLATSKELAERTERIFGKGWKPEIDTMDTFVCSSWYYFRFADPKNEKEFASTAQIKKWLPVDLYVGGAEHTVLHLMYARFFTKALQKFGHIDFTEPFLKLRHQGTILAEDGSKMSKSKGNVVNPDDVIAKFGADALRLHIMFLGPFEAMKPWNTNNIMGILRFLERVGKLEIGEDALNQKTKTLLHQTIKKIGEDLEELKMNTPISSLMILLNEFETLQTVPKDAYKIFLQLLYPFAPHMASELWEKNGFVADISKQPWPTYDTAALVGGVVKVAVQVNGKVRGSIELTQGASEGEALTAARADAGVAKWLALGKEEKAVYVAGRIISFVVSTDPV